MSDIFAVFQKLLDALPVVGETTIQELAGPSCEVTAECGCVILHRKNFCFNEESVVFVTELGDGGFQITGTDKQGYGMFQSSLPLSPFMLIGEQLQFQNDVRGTVYLRNIREFFEKDLNQVKFSDLYLDIGSTMEDCGKGMLFPGQMGRYTAGTYRGAGDSIITPYASSLMGTAILLQAFKESDAFDHVCCALVRNDRQSYQWAKHFLQNKHTVFCGSCAESDLQQEGKLRNGAARIPGSCREMSHVDSSSFQSVIWEQFKKNWWSEIVTEAILLPIRNLYTQGEVYSQKDADLMLNALVAACKGTSAKEVS